MIERAVPSVPSHILVADDERSIRLMLEAGLKLTVSGRLLYPLVRWPLKSRGTAVSTPC